MRDSPSHVHTDITRMRYNPRTDNALSIDEIAKQCMDAVKANCPGPADYLEHALEGLHLMYMKQGRSSDQHIKDVATLVAAAAAAI